jgi:hypothetical protein
LQQTLNCTALNAKDVLYIFQGFHTFKAEVDRLSKKIIAPSPYFELCFYDFVGNAPYKFTPLLNLIPLIIDLKPFGWL